MPDPYLIVLAVAAVLLFVMSLPYCGAHFLRSLETYRPLDPDPSPSVAGAIVIMGGDVHWYAPEFGGQTVGRLTLERLRYGAALHRQTGLPIMVTGGAQANAETTIADMMRDVLEQEYNLPVQLVERRARSTAENARFSAAILGRQGISSVYLVSHAWHMRRAMAAFQAAGVTCMAAPTHSTGRPTPIWTDFRPSIRAFQQCCWAAHEWYALLRDRLRPAQKLPAEPSPKGVVSGASDEIAADPSPVVMTSEAGDRITAIKRR